MRREQTKIVRQRENLRHDRAVKCLGAAFLEVCSAAASDKQSVAGESDALLLHDEGHAAVGVARSGHCDKLVTTELDDLAVVQPAIGVGSGVLANDAERSRQQLLEVSGARDVICMTMRVQGELELKTELLDQGRVPRSLLQH